MTFSLCLPTGFASHVNFTVLVAPFGGMYNVVLLASSGDINWVSSSICILTGTSTGSSPLFLMVAFIETLLLYIGARGSIS